MILSDEHQKFREKIRKYADEIVAPRAIELDKNDEFPHDLVKQMGEMGLYGLCVPEKYGGSQQGTLMYAIAVDEISRACGSTGIFYAAHTSLAVAPIYLAGNDEQKQKWLTPLAKGEKIGSFGLTEPNAGSDGPKRIPLTPKKSSANRTATAFCSYHPISKEIGRTLM